MLKIKNVTKYYGNILAVDNLSFEIKDGEIFGLLGVNGAGKTTTFRMIMGLLDKNEGEITLNGKEIDYSVTDKIGFLTEERSLMGKMTVEEQVVFFGILKGMEESKVKEKLDYYLNEFNITEYKNRKIKELSKGNQQKIQFITSIIHEPKLLMLDEPFSGLDPINIEMFKKVIMDMKEKGTIIIFSSHRMDHIEYFCDSLVILVQGRPVLSGRLSDIKKEYRKKNIKIKGTLDKKAVLKIKGVVSVEKDAAEYVVKIEDDSVVKKVFKEILKSDDITKFEVEEASLNEIFIEKVGESYGK